MVFINSESQQNTIKPRLLRDRVPSKADRNEEIRRLADLTLTIHKRLKQLLSEADALITTK